MFPPRMKRSLVSSEFTEASASVRRELRAEAEEAERDAAAAAAMGRTMAGAMGELMQRGDVVSVSARGAVFRGPVIHAGEDYFAVASGSSRVDVPAGSAVVALTARATSGGMGPSRGEAPTLRARLMELRIDAARVEMGAGSGAVLAGSVEAVGADHVVLRSSGGDPAWIPFERIDFVAAQQGYR